jgi:hypothetical protein
MYYFSFIIQYVNSTALVKLCEYDDGKTVVKTVQCWNLEEYANSVETEIKGEI